MGQLIARLHEAFPASCRVDYLGVCGIERSDVLTEADAAQVRALGGALALLHRNGCLLGNFYENTEIRYYWDCHLTIRGFNAIDSLAKAADGPLDASAIISAFEHASC